MANPTSRRAPSRGLSAERLTQFCRLHVFADLALDGEGLRPWLETLVEQGLLLRLETGVHTPARYVPSPSARQWWRLIGEAFVDVDRPIGVAA